MSDWSSFGSAQPASGFGTFGSYGDDSYDDSSSYGVPDSYDMMYGSTGTPMTQASPGYGYMSPSVGTFGSMSPTQNGQQQSQQQQSNSSPLDQFNSAKNHVNEAKNVKDMTSGADEVGKVAEDAGKAAKAEKTGGFFAEAGKFGSKLFGLGEKAAAPVLDAAENVVPEAKGLKVVEVAGKAAKALPFAEELGKNFGLDF